MENSRIYFNRGKEYKQAKERKGEREGEKKGERERERGLLLPWKG